MKAKQVFLYFFLIFNLSLASCASKQPTIEATPEVSSPTETLLPIESIPTQSGTPQTSGVANSNGWVIYDDTKNIVTINLDTGETKVIISRDQLQIILAEDKSEDSYTYGYEKPIEINLSPDFTKAHVTICASLDVRFRCVFEDFVYNIENKSAVKLNTPPDTYAVYWKWSPDGSKLAGAAWTYNAATYELTRFYSIKSDGTNLVSIAPITNEHWEIAWHPGSTAVLPLTFVTNFRSIYSDGSNEADILIEGLEWNDKIECLGFSPDTNKVAFVIRRELPKNHDWLYVARSDFKEVSLITDFDNDSRYSCQVTWSADQNFIHLGYQYALREEASTEDFSVELPSRDKVIAISNGEEMALPTNAQICGFTSENTMIYAKNSLSGEKLGIDLFSLTNSDVTSLPENVKNTIKYCPIHWRAEELDLEIPEGLATPNACHAGATYTDDLNTETVPAVFDLVEASSSLDGEVLRNYLKRHFEPTFDTTA